MPEMMQGVMYSHELYHALQDQHFGLVRYMDMGGKSDAGSRNGDSNSRARQSSRERRHT